MRDNEKFLNDNPISDAYYGRTIDGSWAKKMADDLKYGKISHEDAVGIYLALNAINDAKIYSSPESIEEAFAVRQALHKIRNTVSNSDDHYVRQYRRDGKTTWAAYRGSDYLGDYDSEEEALNVIQDSITDRTMIGPTKPAGLASTSRNTFSDTKSRYAESLDAEIADASDYLSRLEDALDEWNQTGVWKGEDYGVVITPGRPPRNMTREQMLEVNYNPDNFAGAVQSRIQELGLELSDMEASRSRLDKQGSNTTPIEAILDDPDVLARIEKRAEEVSAMSRPERSELFRDGEYEYVVHWGADVLEGGVLDPARSRGDETSASTVGNTRRINKVTAMQLVANRDDQKQKLSDLTKIQQEFEETGMVNLSSAENPFGVERLIGSLVSRGKDRNANYHGDRAYRPFPDKDDLNEMGIDELTPEMKENIATILERSRNGSEQTLARLDKVADKLIEDDYQYSSTYPAEKLQTANGYGGRYGEEGDSWKNDAPKATRTGIHVFRVRIGEDATRDTGGPDEVHIIGQHTPIASLSVETHRNAGHQPGSAQSTWQGWLAEVIEADKASRSGLASTANLTPEQSSVYTSIQQRVAGLASRGTPTNPIGKNTEEIAKEIDLSPEEMKILEQLIPNADKIADVDVNPALEGSADELLGSVRVTVGDDGIPFIYASPHPFLSEEIPDKRNWSAVIRPKKETLEKVKQLIDNLVKKSMGDDTPEEFWARSTGDGDKTEITDAFRDEARKLRTSFTTWAKDLLDNVTETKQEAPANNQFRLFDNMGQPTWLGMWAESLRDLASPNVLTFFGDNELTSHDVWGHLGTGRGFDRHGEWANMLAMFSLMDRWSEEKGISKEELVKLKASWFQSFEFGRVDGEFKPPAEQIRQEDKWYIKQWAIDSAFDFADTTDLEELISLIDDGNTHTGASKGLASTRGTELAEIAKIDIVRQSIKNNGAKNGLASTQLTPTDDIEEAKRTGRPVNMFRPGTLPPKTQAEYDAVLEQQMRNLEEAKELRKRYQEIWDRDPTPPYSDEEKDAIQASNKIRNELLFQFVDLTPLNRIMRDELKELGFDDETETRVRRAISDHLSVHISYFISGQYSQESTLGNEARLQHSVDALDKADIAVAFPKDLLEKLLEDGRFKTQFETKTSRGALHPEGRITGDIAQFGYHPDTAPEMRPVYGYLTSGGTIDRNMFGSIKQYGELQFILKRDSHSRSTYTTHDSLSSGLTPAPMGVPSKDASGKVGETMYAEAQIHGGLSLSDVDYVVVNVGEPDQNDWRNNKVSEEEFESISGMLARVGIRVVPVRNGEIADTWNGGKAIPEQPVEVVAQSQEPVKVVA
jgi:hypothetical protein